MKSLKSYLIESEQTYKFRIKMAHECSDERMEALETALEKYELKSLSKPKKTPIQEHPMDFQTLNNAEVFIMDAEVNYPVTAHQLYEYLSQTVGVPASHLVVINSDHPEEIAREEAITEEEYEGKYQKVSNINEDGIVEWSELNLKAPENIDWSGLETFETEDTTNGNRELACSADSCEVVDIVAAE